jgi:hypothetical protein
MMKPTMNRIDDKYTKRGYILASPNMHDALEFEYRPMLAEQVEDLDALVEKSSPASTVALIATCVAKQLISWSEVERDTPAGAPHKPVAVSADNVRRLPHPVLAKLRKIISGVIPSDPLPDANEAELSQYAAELKAAADGMPAGLVSLANDAKN